MSFFLGLLGVLIGFIIVIVILASIIFMIYKKITATITDTIGIKNANEIKNAAKNIKNLKDEEYTREKNVSGMTKLLEPEILKDFPEFNKDLLFTIIEKELRKVFNSLENKSISSLEDDSESIIILPKVKEQIEDMKSTNTTVRYDDVVFHRHAIKKYLKSQGIATIETSTTLEYYYYNSKKENNNLKKQTRYTCEFIYIYDETKFEDKKGYFTISCPNCGAPIRGLTNQICEYCTTKVHPINLKLWKMSSYKEDYK